MGANLKPIVRNFSIHKETFTADSYDVEDGIVTPGSHEVMRFDFLIHNAGNADFVVGSPEDQPDLFVWSVGHDHYHYKDFNDYVLLDKTGKPTAVGDKQAFCLMDEERLSPWADPEPGYTNCNVDQGISAGWADLYESSLPGQYLVIDGVPDGNYTLVAAVNAQHAAAEDSYTDNTIAVGLRLDGDTVHVIAPSTSGAAVAALDDLWA